ncbi:MAG: ribosomal-processing cysteine protease Prp [Ezakiella sp.]|nr:ribosomal-processing cysteine protease Prp [Ezakiella sp.]MDD7761151.1 ribosomal-processing cysteine protease Prp [Bacillota bacterium]MDY3947310.1 ribosomal-processing cysteine protease Prp [Ezakiella sp.]
MVKVTLYRKNNRYCGYKSSGHADYADKGEDIVCSAISILTYTIYRSAVVNLCLREEDYSLRTKDGFLEFRIKRQDDNTELLFDTLKEGILSLQENYGRYVQLEILEMEETND